MTDELTNVLDEMRTASEKAQKTESYPQYELSDLGNARRLVDAFGTDIRYVPEWGKWIVWTETHWKLDLTGQVLRFAKQVADTILDQARVNTDEKQFRHRLKAQSAGGLNAMVSVASTEPGIPVLVDELDGDPWLVTVANGTLDLRTGILSAPERADLITKTSPVRWDSEATCPTWDTFLQTILPDPEVRAFLQRASGYALTGDVREQIMLIFYGLGSNGKTTFKEAICDAFGDHAIAAAPKLLLATRHESHPTSIADLHGRRLVVSHEVEDGLRLDEALTKELTGGDRLKARYMRQDFWSFRPTHKLWMACNHRPRISGTDHGIWRRVRLVKFDVTIPDEQQDKDLPAKLKAELPGILRWAVEGCLAWQDSGLRAPKVVLDDTAEYRRESDLVAQFLNERCVEGSGFQVRSADLYNEYKGWCQANGLDHPLSQKALASQLVERGLDRTENRAGQAVWIDIGLAAASNGSAGATP